MYRLTNVANAKEVNINQKEIFMEKKDTDFKIIYNSGLAATRTDGTTTSISDRLEETSLPSSVGHGPRSTRTYRVTRLRRLIPARELHKPSKLAHYEHHASITGHTMNALFLLLAG